jgi:DNA processing protein
MAIELWRIEQEDEKYPRLLSDLSKFPDGNQPRTIGCRGNYTLLKKPAIAIVGTRNPSKIGCEHAFKIAARLASEGFVIVSGLAKGIDTAAHRGALSVGGMTIAVLGTTLDWDDIYPRENAPLAAEIVSKGGCLLTDYFTHAFDRSRFMKRDRLQAALSVMVIPVQAGTGSGTMHTVGWAQKLDRLIAIPAFQKADYEQSPDKYAGLYGILPRYGSFTATTMSERVIKPAYKKWDEMWYRS